MEFDMETRVVDQTPRQLSPQPKSPSPSPQTPHDKFNIVHQDRHSDIEDFAGEKVEVEEERTIQKRHSNPEIQAFYQDSNPNFPLEEPSSSPAVEGFETSLFVSTSNEPPDNHTNPQISPSLISAFAPYEHCSSTDLGHCSEPIYFGRTSETPPPLLARDFVSEPPDLKENVQISSELGKDNSEISSVDLSQLHRDPDHFSLEREICDRNSSPELEEKFIGLEEEERPVHSLDQARTLENNRESAESSEIEREEIFSPEVKNRVSPELADNIIDKEVAISQSPISEDYNMFATKQHNTSFEDQEQPAPITHVPTTTHNDHFKATELMGDQLLDFGEDSKVPVRGEVVYEDKGHSPSPTSFPDAMGQRRTVDECVSSEPASPQSTSALTDVFSSPQKDPSHDAASPVRTERQEATNQAIEDLTNMIEKVNLRSNHQDPTSVLPLARDQHHHQMAEDNFHVKTNGDHQIGPYCGGLEDVGGAMGQSLPEEQPAMNFGLENGHRTPHSPPVNEGANSITPVVAVKSPTAGATKKISQTAPAKSSNNVATKTAHGANTTFTHGKGSNGIDHHGLGQDHAKAKTAKSNGVGVKAAPATAKPKGTTRKTDYSHVQSKCGSLAFIKGTHVPAVKAKDSTKVDGPHHDTMATTTTHTAGHTPNGLHMGNGTSVNKRPTPTTTANQVKGGAAIGNGTAAAGAGHSLSHQGYKKPANLKTVHSKVGSLENASYKPARIEKKIETVKLDFKCKAKSKIGSLDNAAYVPQGGNVKVQTHKLNFKETAAPKVQTKFIKSPQTATSPLVETGDA